MTTQRRVRKTPLLASSRELMAAFVHSLGMRRIPDYMDGRILSIVPTTITTELRFGDLWDCIRPFGGVLQTEHHLLSNQAVYSVLTYIVRPRTRLGMQK